MDDRRNLVRTPIEAFIKWFDSLPVPLREYLAHIFKVATTDDTSEMAALPEQSLQGFRNWAVKKDFPLRVSARIFYIRSIFDLVILHYSEILGAKNHCHPSPCKAKITQISSKQWEHVLDSWKVLRKHEMSDNYIHSWASWMFKKKGD